MTASPSNPLSIRRAVLRRFAGVMALIAVVGALAVGVLVSLLDDYRSLVDGFSRSEYHAVATATEDYAELAEIHRLLMGILLRARRNEVDEAGVFAESSIVLSRLDRLAQRTTDRPRTAPWQDAFVRSLQTYRGAVSIALQTISVDLSRAEIYVIRTGESFGQANQALASGLRQGVTEIGADAQKLFDQAENRLYLLFILGAAGCLLAASVVGVVMSRFLRQLDGIDQQLNQLSQGNSVASVETLPVLAEFRPVQATLAMLRGVMAERDAAYAVLEDKVDIRTRELALYQKAFTVTDEAIIITDAHASIVDVNPAFEHITGYERQAVLGLNPRFAHSGLHDSAFFSAMWQHLLKEGRWAGEIWDRRQNGEIYPKWLTINAVTNAQGEVSHYIGAFRDISAQKAHEARLSELAHQDTLTGLPNRMALNAHLERALNRADRQESLLAVMFVDLDHFKAVNDTLGHAVGDALLCEVARRLQQGLRNSDLVARFGGDEFVVVLENLQNTEDAKTIAEKMLASLQGPLKLLGHDLGVTPSIGISLYPLHGEDLHTLLQRADAAMYLAKSEGRNAVRIAVSARPPQVDF